ncbi:uncharacterized protein LAESUDRAFT_193182 [Laetiporus sulphureus 93-53]|uniref:RBR-type E3 ubiquitin transferase n=1 Tax=Laetiporus sulphureus 93-53 TaxID=1314785 RepID=A0A165E7A8_9APHY|nr:uncharacterized protein LAESUDRAFT_193182 [Laetiporus sulphureus 93-53]KZT06379.1 hypothetical protein LAESUDRAFT_193182 [Laetiporus sulphureus 93-53]
MFRMATVDESAFPPSCCQAAIPLDSVRQLLDDSLVERFQRKSLEFTTTDRVYCYRLTCSTFLGGATSRPSSLRCPQCRAETCSACKEEAHETRPCSSHLNEAVLALAKERQWQRCPGCRHLVELVLGCYHMQCICKKQFCYLCAATWKECSCPQFAEERLLL